MKFNVKTKIKNDFEMKIKIKISSRKQGGGYMPPYTSFFRTRYVLVQTAVLGININNIFHIMYIFPVDLCTSSVLIFAVQMFRGGRKFAV